MPISCHFGDCEALLVLSLLVSSTTASTRTFTETRQTPLTLQHNSLQCCDKTNERLHNLFLFRQLTAVLTLYLSLLLILLYQLLQSVHALERRFIRHVIDYHITLQNFA